MNNNDMPRPVWLTQYQRDLFANLQSYKQARELVAAWDAAPADARATAKAAITDETATDIRYWQSEIADAVLHALGCPNK